MLYISELQSVHGSKVRLVMKELEKSYWLTISLVLPRTVTKANIVKEANQDSQIFEYHDDELNDFFIKLIIEQIYETYFLFNGSLSSQWEKNNYSLDNLRNVCSSFFDWYLPSLKLTTINLIELFGAIQYLPLDHLTYITAQSFINHTLASDSHCKHVLFFYNDQLITSSLDLRNTRIIYRYLVYTLIPEIAAEEMSESIRSKMHKKCRFVRKCVPIFCLHSNNTYFMNIYRSINRASVVLLFDSVSQYDLDDSLNKCDTYMSEKLPDLAQKLGEVSTKFAESTSISNYSNHDQHQVDMFRFVYYNGSNSAFKSNSLSKGIFDSRKLNESEFVKLIIDLNSDLKTCLNNEGGKNLVEIIAKTTNESWLIVHECDARTLFSLLNHKNANLIEAAETVYSHVSKQFKNILFID